jgi:ABC-type multidrug transport system fused ATPase/permease subunit
VAYFAVYSVGVGLSALELVLEWLVPKKLSAYDALGDEYECPYNYANVFSVLTFNWMTPLMKYGYKHFLTQDDLWNLRQKDTTRASWQSFQNAWSEQLERKHPNLWFALIKAYGAPYFRGAIFKTCSDILQFVQPQLLRLLIAWVDSQTRPEPQPVIRGAAIALAMFAVSFSQTAVLHQYFQRVFETGMRIKSGLTATIYSKAMKLSNEGRATKSTGDIVNYMAVDVQRLQDLTQFGQQLWSSPFQIVLAFASLYQLVGWSFLAGVGVMILMIPINAIIARFMKSLQKIQMGNKDQRTRLMTEILNNMKSIKLYAWTTAFMNKLSYVRNDLELSTLRKIGATQAFANFTWSTTPFLVSCSTFAVFVLTQKQPLSTEIVFPALTLFNLLTFPLSMLPMVITSFIEASVAVGRMTSYLAADELQEDAVKQEPTVEEIGEESVRVRDATFTWNNTEGRTVLEAVNFTAQKGELSCIVGRVGAGKSSFLQALLGDLYKMRGEVIIRGRCAYVAQSPWVMNASVRENIVFGHRWDPHFYNKTIRACALQDDFATLPDGDQTEVGERGISLSGGQKARLTLARAVYARADIVSHNFIDASILMHVRGLRSPRNMYHAVHCPIFIPEGSMPNTVQYLLDDVLSAVDQHVGRHIIDNVLGPKGLLASKTRILATNSIPVLMEANFVLLLRDGRVTERGTYQQLIAMKGEIAQLIRTANNETEQMQSPDRPESLASDETVYDEEQDSDDGDEHEVEAVQEGLAQLAPLRTTGATTRRQSALTLRRASTASFKGPPGKVTDEEANGGLKTKQTAEKSEQGKVKWSVYLEYAKTSNLMAVSIYLLTLIGAQTASIGMYSYHAKHTSVLYGLCCEPPLSHSCMPGS